MKKYNDNKLTIDNITREKVERYLKDYPFTKSTEMDPIFKRFRSDVYSLAEEVRKGIAYIYDIDDLIEQIEVIYAEAGEQYLQDEINELHEALEGGYKVVIDRYGEYTYL